MIQNEQARTEEHTEGTAMQTIDLEFLSFSSYVRLCTLISICLGFAAGILFFLLDLFGVDTSMQLGLLRVATTEAGIVFLFIGPFVFAVVGFLGSVLTYRLFLWSLRTFWGLALTGRWKEISATTIHGTQGNLSRVTSLDQ